LESTISGFGDPQRKAWGRPFMSQLVASERQSTSRLKSKPRFRQSHQPGKLPTQASSRPKFARHNEMKAEAKRPALSATFSARNFSLACLIPVHFGPTRPGFAFIFGRDISACSRQCWCEFQPAHAAGSPQNPSAKLGLTHHHALSRRLVATKPMQADLVRHSQATGGNPTKADTPSAFFELFRASSPPFPFPPFPFPIRICSRRASRLSQRGRIFLSRFTLHASRSRFTAPPLVIFALFVAIIPVTQLYAGRLFPIPLA